MWNFGKVSDVDAAFVKAVSCVLADHPKLYAYIFKDGKCELKDTDEKIIYNSGVLSSGEQLLVCISLDLWNGSNNVKFVDVYSVLGKQYVLKFCDALNMISQSKGV